MRLSEKLRTALLAEANAIRAPQMQAYMKSVMPSIGVASPQMKATSKALFAELQYDDARKWMADILDIWRGAVFREEYYAAIELTGIKQARPFQRTDILPMYREMIIAGGWWDTTDSIAPTRLGEILHADREAMSQAMLEWAVDDNMWVRRSAILCQLKAKDDMDLDLLYGCIEPSISSKEFFLRKAIGWVLRQYARTNPQEVRRYVSANEARLSNLTKREALKHLD